MAAAPASSSSRPIWKCIETVEKKLEDDYEILLEAKEAILKELKHLKAEEVTLQQLIKEHTKSSTKESKQTSSVPSGMEWSASDNSSSSLPAINLNITNSRLRSKANEEEELDSDCETDSS